MKEHTTNWLKTTVDNSELSEQDKKTALAIGIDMIAQDYLKGDISEAFIKKGWSNEEFNFELYL